MRSGFHPADPPDGYLTKSEFLLAYGACGDLLHALNPFRPAIDYRARIAQAKRWAELAAALIRIHVVEVLGYPGPLIVEVLDNQAARVLLTKPVDDGEFTFAGRFVSR
jgi:hypothetical protein